jgi:hypothetical protein
MEEKTLITEDILIKAGFKQHKEEAYQYLTELAKHYGANQPIKNFHKWTDDEQPIKLDIDNGLNNSGRKWSLHIDNCDCDSIGYVTVDYTWQFNKFMEILDSKFRL